MNQTAHTLGAVAHHKNYGSMMAAERDQANLDRLMRIKENIERQAKKEVERLHKMVDKRERKE